MVEEYLNVTTSSMVFLQEKPQILENVFVRAGVILLYSLIFLICFFGNLAVIMVVLLQWKRRSVSKFCLGSMALANFSVSLFCILQNLTLYLLDNWIFGELMCKLYHFITSLCQAASILMAVLISIERYVVLLHALRCRQILTTRTLLLIIFGVWLLSAAISLPHFLYFGLIIRNQPNGNGDICAPMKSMFNSATADAVYFLLMYLIPLLVMSTLYLRVGLFLRRSESLRRELDEERPPGNIALSSSIKLRTSQKNLDEQIGEVERPGGLQNTSRSYSNHCLFRDTKGYYEVKRYVAGRLSSNSSGISSNGTSATLLSTKVMNVHFDPSMVLYRYNRLQLSHVRCKQRQRLVRRFIFIVITFAVLNLPFHLRKLCLHYAPSLANTDDNLIALFTFALMYANCAINPILYAFMSKNFRSSLNELCWKGGRTISKV